MRSAPPMAAGFAVLALLAAASSASLHAQLRPGVGLGGGAGIAAGGISDVVDPGFSVDARLTLRGLEAPLGLRFDVGYEEMPSRAGADLMQLSLTAAAVLHLRQTGLLSPYIALGGGIYGDRWSLDTTDAPLDAMSFGHRAGLGVHWTTHPGLTAAFGFDLPIRSGRFFAEGRLHYVLTPGRRITTLPIGVGVSF